MRVPPGGANVFHFTSSDFAEATEYVVRRELKAKFEMRLFENPYADSEKAEKWNNLESHKNLASEAAAKSMILLKKNGVFPPLKKLML